MDQNYERFKALLNQNLQFPTTYVHKFIGPNTAEFRASVSDFEKKFIALTRAGEKLSSSNAHLSLTYDYLAASAQDVVDLTVATHKIPGVLYIL